MEDTGNKGVSVQDPSDVDSCMTQRPGQLPPKVWHMCSRHILPFVCSGIVYSAPSKHLQTTGYSEETHTVSRDHCTSWCFVSILKAKKLFVCVSCSCAHCEHNCIRKSCALCVSTLQMFAKPFSVWLKVLTDFCVGIVTFPFPAYSP